MKEEEGKRTTSITQNISLKDSQPWICQNPDLLTTNDKSRVWEQKKLINKLNYINFTNGHVLLLFQHKKSSQQILTKAFPEPCVNNELTCRLDSSELIDRTNHELIYLLIDDGLAIAAAPVQLISGNDNKLKILLPDRSSITTNRNSRRHNCNNVTCEIIQDDFSAQGTLTDFAPCSLGIQLYGNSNIIPMDSNKSAQINLTQNGAKLFSGLCRYIRDGKDSQEGKVVLAPLDVNKPLFEKREKRNPRQHIIPSLKLSFRHPLFQGNVERDIFEISTSGFSLRDSMEEETLLPGMVIPHLTIVYAGIVKMNCSVQVVYREEDKENKMVKCGLAITDMDVQDYSHLSHILGVYLDSHARVSTKVDMDALWEFFFDTGFIYGEKYQFLQPYRSDFKETYQKLYQRNPDIARHFIYEENGKIYGHLSMVHAYQSSWLIHHFAAREMGTKIPGLMVLRQITHYINGFYRYPSSKMHYQMTYYQPENNFIDKIFGGFARHLNNQEGSSLDLFSYVHYHKSSFDQELPAEWLLRECGADDFKVMKSFYDTHSGGLMLDAFGLDTPMEPLKESFTKAGCKRNCQTFCLCHKGQQVAFFIVNQSDFGLNLSDLLNGIQIIIVNNELRWEIITSAISKLGKFYKEDRIPLLIYPSTYLSEQSVSNKKKYQLWIIKLDPYLEQYTEYVGNKFRIRYRI